MFNRSLGILFAGAASLVAWSAGPAQADACAASTTCSTTTSFSVTAEGALSITVPSPGSPVDIGSGVSGGTITGRLGPITVADQRAALSATWTSSVVAAAGGFTTGGGTAAETVPNTDVLYWSGGATATTGTGTFVPGQTNAAAAQSLDTTRTAYSKSSGSGDNSCTWNPWVVINVPDAAVAGTYTGTVNHSVA